jgi:hypothetical protein
MTFKVDGANGLTFPNNTTQASAGQVLQVVGFSNQGGSVSTSSSSYVSSGFAVTITPKFATSKIYICASTNTYDGSSGPSGLFTIYRNSTNLASGTAPSALTGVYSSSGAIVVPLTMQFLDSPATTSATTYTIYYLTNSGVMYLNFANGSANSMGTNIVAMEIAA